ncbi:hypothetical protein K492DRAFT_176656 [Lichtheimia hyalospora FSU 10163]|nr:hypothetical protein K492DRAFT_176656 [Lichtheimia hyalospora FSU 10163]
MATHSVQSITNDSSAWPSRYYGKTRHIDLEKIYHDIVTQSSQTPDKKTQRQVSFSDDAPIVHEYEPECDEDEDVNANYDDAPPQYFPTVFVANTPDFDRDMEATSVVYRKKKRASVRRLDLRPIQNPEYRKTTPTLVKDDDDAASVSSAEPITPEATTVPPMPERTCSTCSCPQPVSAQKQQTRRITINRIRSSSWIPKSIQNIL